MSEQSDLAVLGLRLGVLGSLASLALAAPLADGDLSDEARTDAARIGFYFRRNAGLECMRHVVMGRDILCVGVKGISSWVNSVGKEVGDANEVWGFDAGNTNFTGTGNTFFGQYCAKGKSGGGGANTAFGHRAMEIGSGGSLNDAFGTQALRNVTNNHNKAFGYHALRECTSGEGNVGIGSWAFEILTSGSRNVGIGRRVAVLLASGSDNTYLGAFAAPNATTGSHNCGLGANTLPNITTGRGNIGLGRYAGNGRGNSDNKLYVGTTATGGGAYAINAVRIESTDVRGPLWETPNRFAAATATSAGVNLGVGVDPLSPQDGDIWVTASSIFARVGGVTYDLLA